MSASGASCPSCGARTSGRFCGACGASLGGERCARCGRNRSPGDRFCPGCGAPAGAGRGSERGDRTGWIAAGAATLVLLGVLIAFLAKREPVGTNPVVPTMVAPEAAGGTPPDISNMSPKERFDRLYNRVMAASESGDEATVSQFLPMATMAFQQLDTVDADARYHLAMMQMHTGQAGAAAAQADSILLAQPGHLFGYMVRASVSRWQKDDAARGKAEREFLSHYDAELAAKRPEYGEHARAVEQFRQRILEASGSGAPGKGTT